MLSAAYRTVHNETKHIDAIVPGKIGLVACAASALTGDTWDGRLQVLDLKGTKELGTGAAVVAEAYSASGIAGVAWVSDDTLATGDDAGDLSLWQLGAPADGGKRDLSPIASFGEHSQPITAVVACPSAPTRLVTTSLDGTAKVWAASVAGSATTSLDHLPVHAWCEVHVHCAAWLGASSDLMGTGASDGVVRLWDLRSARPAASRFAPHTASVLSLLSGAADGQLLAGAESGDLLLFDARKLSEPVTSVSVRSTLGDRPQPAAALTALCQLGVPSGMGVVSEVVSSSFVAAGTEEGIILTVDPRDLHVISSAVAHEGNAATVAGLPAAAGGSDRGLTLLSGGWDKKLLRHDLTTISPRSDA